MELQSTDGTVAEAGGFSALSGPLAPPVPAADPWVPTLRDVLTKPLPHAGFIDRLVQRGVALFGLGQVRAVYGLEHLRRTPAPFMIAVNHSIKREALIVPAMLDLQRDGRWIRFVADWNFLLIPVIGWVMRRSGVIVVTRKSAKPPFFNRFKPWFEESTAPAERVAARLANGECVGIFPEGTVNRNPRKLLVGRVGMSRLSLEAGVPILPVGIRFPGSDPDRPLTEKAAMEIHIGAPLLPPTEARGRPSISAARSWHRAVMKEISRLSGKSWGLDTQADDDGP